jgi:hypothetical protein
MNEMKSLGFYARLTDKYKDSLRNNNHFFLLININNKNSFELDVHLEKSGLYDRTNIGDTLLKKQGDLFIYNLSQDYNHLLEYNCDTTNQIKRFR